MALMFRVLYRVQKYKKKQKQHLHNENDVHL